MKEYYGYPLSDMLLMDHFFNHPLDSRGKRPMYIQSQALASLLRGIDIPYMDELIPIHVSQGQCGQPFLVLASTDPNDNLPYPPDPVKTAAVARRLATRLAPEWTSADSYVYDESFYMP